MCIDSNIDELIAKHGFDKIIEAITTRSKILIQEYKFDKINNDTIKTPEQIKNENRKHRNAVIKKRTELEMQDIIPETLLTKENLEKWLGMNMTYKQIARELTGCHERCISTLARFHGLRFCKELAGLV